MRGVVITLNFLTLLALLATIAAGIHFAAIPKSSEMAPVAGALVLGFYLLPALLLTLLFFVAGRIAPAYLNADEAAPNMSKGSGLAGKLIDFGFRIAILGVVLKLLTSPWTELGDAPEYFHLVLSALALWALPGLSLALLGYWIGQKGGQRG